MTKHFTYEALEKFCVDLLVAAQCDRAQADIIAKRMVAMNVAGIDTHGINRLPVYMNALQNGRINPCVELTIEDYGAMVYMDADNGLGHYAAHEAMKLGIEKATMHGVGIVFVRHSNHFGAGYEYARLAAERGMSSIIFSNAPEAVAPFGGRKAFFGTNPITFGFPYQEFPIVVDLSTSAVARGKIVKALQEQRDISADWALDKEGHITTNAEEALAGILLPMAGAKGYALACAVEMFSAVFSGASLSPEVGYLYDLDIQSPCDVGHCFIIIDANRREDVMKRTQQFVEKLKAVETVEGIEQVMVPGERRWLERKERLHSGIPLDDKLLDKLNQLAKSLDCQQL